MTMHLVPSRLRFLRAASLAGACLCATSLGQGCSGSDVRIIGAGGTQANAAPPEPDPSDDLPSQEMVPPEDRGPSNTPEPPSAGGNEGTGGAPSLDPQTAVSPGSGGSLPTLPPADGSEPPSEPPPSDPPSAPPPSVPPSDPPPAGPVSGEPAVIDCAPPQGTMPGLKLTPIATGLAEPTFATAAPGDDTRLYVLEKSGAIRIIRNGQLLAEPFLDLKEFVDTFNEQGLIGLAFHPDYADNGRFFVQYAFLDTTRQPSDPHEVILSEFARSEESPDRALLESERVLMVVEQPSDIHLGGMLAFGPTDGMLYISRGDGGSGGSQDLDSRLGKMLRIDVDEESDGLPYGIPDGNLSGDGVRPEIWSLGLRNPWRFAFDACTGDIYIGDVGESSFEEIDFEPAGVVGLNHGWKVVEGPSCFEATEPCDATGFTPAVLLYERDFGCAVTGGYVYRGARIPALRGTYIYADYCFGNFGSFRMQGGQAVDVRDITADINPEDISAITSFGVDNAGEMYVMSQLGGLYRIDPE
jgi:glucose/arabinose dehydrogenase